jgi:GNAT superfamily N-acetyltransferase
MTLQSITPHHTLSIGQIDAVERRLDAMNMQRTGYHDAEQLGFVVEQGADIVAMVSGYSWGGVCELLQVWVDEPYRGAGLGSRLMKAALDEARRRGCAHVFLTTYGFQAHGFYKKLGFTAIAELADKPLGHSEYVMRYSFV